MTTTEKHIADFAKSLRECNRCPVMPEEDIVSIKRIIGRDGRERELIVVKKLATKLASPGDINHEHTFRNDGKGTLKMQSELRKGYGIGQGIITDLHTLRYVK